MYAYIHKVASGNSCGTRDGNSLPQSLGAVWGQDALAHSSHVPFCPSSPSVLASTPPNVDSAASSPTFSQNLGAGMHSSACVIKWGVHDSPPRPHEGRSGRLTGHVWEGRAGTLFTACRWEAGWGGSLPGYLTSQPAWALTTGALTFLQCLYGNGFTLFGPNFPKELLCFWKGPSPGPPAPPTSSAGLLFVDLNHPQQNSHDKQVTDLPLGVDGTGWGMTATWALCFCVKRTARWEPASGWGQQLDPVALQLCL